MVEDVESRVRAYTSDCEAMGHRPTGAGLSQALHISERTLWHICAGCYARGKPYTTTPSASRCISNDDFEVIKAALS